ncbi:hypothetical protein [Agrobacterium sp. lyk4-40-TYG-31]|uniref:hypothetical protein n=1 Tax=Agrobacterium sp. lyk4-40-TYG-31 TaxID=3040276 RepID=UPI00254A5361|nr:hypothetical protein [Agrobacterium sp. lyk4-40-TYG-31]
MLGIFKFFDAYNLRARVFPAMVAGLPTLALILAVVPWDRLELSHLIATVMSLTLIWAFSDFARQSGIKVEQKLGSRSTLYLWYHNNHELDSISKKRFREFMAGKLGVPAPTAEQETDDPAKADDFYAAASAWLRGATRDTKVFKILFEELMTYGARRNLLGLKKIALGMNLVVISVCASALYFEWSHPSLSNLQEKLAIVILAVFLHSIYMIFAVKKSSVLTASRAYGKQLVLSCDELMKPKSATVRRPRNVSKT